MKTNTQLKVLAAAVILASSANVLAADVTVSVTATVNNAVNLQKLTDLAIGEIRATASSTATATMIIPSNPSSSVTYGTTGDGSASVQSLDGAAAPATFKIAGVPTYTALTITLPVSAAVTTQAGGDAFELNSLTAYTTSVGGGAVALTSGVGTMNSNALTEIDFNVGATLETTSDSTPEIKDGAFTGSFNVNVVY